MAESKLTRFRSDDGTVLTFYQVAMQAVKEGKAVEETEDGYRINGQPFRRAPDD